MALDRASGYWQRGPMVATLEWYMARIGTGVVAASLLACAGDSGSDSESSSASEASSSASEASSSASATSSSSGDGGELDYCPGVDEVAGTPCRIADDCDAE